MRHGSEGAVSAPSALGIDSIEHGAFLDDEALDLMKARGTYFVPTLMALEGGKEILAKGGYPPLVAEKMKAGAGIRQHSGAETRLIKGREDRARNRRRRRLIHTAGTPRNFIC